ncbi:hypothetical protein [Caldimonas brevitalea]|uniref:hypothetical protein n=1 Tax=Caldimonas brevitalea TaxID=413882 RepID=UPI0012F9D5D0|nr:hypothetical protein [Caldimonas brevitalea]
MGIKLSAFKMNDRGLFAMSNENDVNYTGYRSYLLNKLGRRLSEDEQGCIKSFGDIGGHVFEEAKKMSRMSTAYGTAYLTFVLAPRLTRYAADLASEVFRGGMPLEAWIDRLARADPAFPK